MGTVAIVLSLTGCTAPVVAVAGIGVDRLGRPVGYLQVCDDQIDGATVYTTMGAERGHARWTATKPVKVFTTWSLTEPTSGWTVDVPLDNPASDVEYRLSGWTDNHAATAREVRFTMPELEHLVPGQVLYWAGDLSAEKDTRLNIVVSPAEFRRDACDALRG